MSVVAEVPLQSQEPYIYRPALVAAAREKVAYLYLPPEEIDYHHEEHYPDTLEAADGLIKRCEANGELVDRETIELALIGHDIYYHIPLDEHPGLSKEEYSALRYSEILQELGVEPDKIARVFTCILFTQPGVHFEDLGGDAIPEDLKKCMKITRRADISNVREFGPVFWSNSIKLFYESKKLHAAAGTTPLPWPKFVLKQQELLGMLLEDDLSLGAFDEDENQQCIFTTLARMSVASLSTDLVLNFSQLIEKHGKKLVQLVPRLGKEQDLEKFAA